MGRSAKTLGQEIEMDFTKRVMGFCRQELGVCPLTPFSLGNMIRKIYEISKSAKISDEFHLFSKMKYALKSSNLVLDLFIFWVTFFGGVP